MTLLNGVAMFAVFTVIVPILIHLRKRRKSKVVDWPAMQFLTRTATSRRRGVTLENLLLLLLRCLLVLLFVLAMARPAIESGRYSSWLMFVLLAGCGLLLMTAAIVSGWQRRNRIIGVMVAALLFGVATATLSVRTESLVDSKMDRDITLVIDSSLTMTLGDGEVSHFEESIAQARSLVESLSGNSTVSIVLAGPITETVDGSPFRNLRKADEVLGMLAPVAGGSVLESAIQQATSLLKRAPNTRKQVLLLTDDQLCTWESIDESRLAGQSPVNNAAVSESALENTLPPAGGSDAVAAGEGRSLPKRLSNGNAFLPARSSRPYQREGKVGFKTVSNAEIACAAIMAHLPKKKTNISVDRLHLKSSLVSANRPVPIEIEIRNGGSTTVQNVAVKLLVDGREAATDSLIQIEPGVSSTVRFLHSFPRSGQHVVSGSIEIADQLSEDNRIDSVIDVIPHLSILAVNGSTDADPAQQSATFAQLALDPISLREPPNGDDIGNADEGNLAGGNVSRAIIATTIEATRLKEIETLEKFQLVMLCDVPRLPIDAAKRLARFVEDGGGLWVIPGEQADTSFYNNWRVSQSGEPVMPAQLGERTQWIGEPTPDGRIPRLGVALDVAGRPFISDLFERGDHDLADVSLLRFWSMTPSEQAIVGMRLTNGESLFAEQSLGRGRVLIQSVSLARRDSTFPTTLAFPVLMHLWTHHLAASHAVNSNIEPTTDFLADLIGRMDPTERIGTLQLSEPSGSKREIPVLWEQDSPFAQIGRAAVPGVYKLNRGDTGAPLVSFAVHRNQDESDLSVVSKDRLSEISHELGIEFIDDVSQLAAPVASESVGAEIWDTLLFTVLWLLAGECLVTKWIRSRRRVAPIATSASNGPDDSPFPVPPFATAMKSSSHWEDIPVDNSVGAPVGAP
ncbi:BatA domain-containing protein [Stieleria sp. ICT_E10.1]|uniref:BatA domain-containing protein n=1 Tax=Stieleria sedimenti TaxID=2976331 RepID=UPI00217F8FDA|nr:BatA domain-containing protein [Stieleria sedimenti]MCS7468604.1 BatA domain-containing protein [Stieleria sedimenti]